MSVILSEAKDRTVGMRICGNQLKIDEAKMINGSSKLLCAYERSRASLGMTAKT